MQEIISIIKYLATTNIINFLIMIVLLYLIIKKVNITQVLNASISIVEKSIKQSENYKKEAKVVLERNEQLITNLPSEIENLQNNAKDKITIFKDEIEDNTQKTLSEIMENIGRTLKVEEKKSSSVILSDASVKSIKLAEENIISALQSNPELYDKFIDESLNEIERVDIKL